MKNIPTKWFQNLPADQQEEFKEVLRASHRTLERLKDMLSQDLERLRDIEEDIEFYDRDSVTKYAHVNGRKAALKHVLQYLSFLEE